MNNNNYDSNYNHREERYQNNNNRYQDQAQQPQSQQLRPRGRSYSGEFESRQPAVPIDDEHQAQQDTLETARLERELLERKKREKQHELELRQQKLLPNETTDTNANQRSNVQLNQNRSNNSNNEAQYGRGNRVGSDGNDRPTMIPPFQKQNERQDNASWERQQRPIVSEDSQFRPTSNNNERNDKVDRTNQNTTTKPPTLLARQLPITTVVETKFTDDKNVDPNKSFASLFPKPAHPETIDSTVIETPVEKPIAEVKNEDSIEVGKYNENENISRYGNEQSKHRLFDHKTNKFVEPKPIVERSHNNNSRRENVKDEPEKRVHIRIKEKEKNEEPLWKRNEKSTEVTNTVSIDGIKSIISHKHVSSSTTTTTIPKNAKILRELTEEEKVLKINREKEKLNRGPRTTGLLFKYNSLNEIEQVLLAGEKSIIDKLFGEKVTTTVNDKNHDKFSNDKKSTSQEKWLKSTEKPTLDLNWDSNDTTNTETNAIENKEKLSTKRSTRKDKPLLKEKLQLNSNESAFLKKIVSTHVKKDVTNDLEKNHLSDLISQKKEIHTKRIKNELENARLKLSNSNSNLSLNKKTPKKEDNNNNSKNNNEIIDSKKSWLNQKSNNLDDKITVEFNNYMSEYGTSADNNNNNNNHNNTTNNVNNVTNLLQNATIEDANW